MVDWTDHLTNHPAAEPPETQVEHLQAENASPGEAMSEALHIMPHVSYVGPHAYYLLTNASTTVCTCPPDTDHVWSQGQKHNSGCPLGAARCSHCKGTGIRPNPQEKP